MKRLIFLFFAVCPLFITAQVVNHFQNSTSKWFVADTYPNANQQNPSFVETSTTVYGFQGDSIDQGTQWFKTYSSSDSAFTTNLEYQGLLREENGYVFFQNATGSTDTLYNFNLELGDSVLYNFWGQFEEYIHVVEIDSVSINGEMYKSLSFDEPIFGFFLMDEKWIEGIGSVHGPLFPLNPEAFSDGEMPDSLELVCSHVDELLYWENQFYDQCLVNIILGSEDIQTAALDIYPNPATERFFIRQAHKSGQYSVRDILGKQVLVGQIQSDNQSVDLSGLQSGIYFVTVQLKGTTLTKEIIKH